MLTPIQRRRPRSAVQPGHVLKESESHERFLPEYFANFSGITVHLAWVVTSDYDTQHVSAPLASLLAMVFEQLHSRLSAGRTN